MCLGETVRKEKRGDEAREPWTLSEPPFPAPLSPPSHSLLSWWLTAGTRGDPGRGGGRGGFWVDEIDRSNTAAARALVQNGSSTREQVVVLVKDMITTLAAAVRIRLAVFSLCADIGCCNAVLTTSQSVNRLSFVFVFVFFKAFIGAPLPCKTQLYLHCSLQLENTKISNCCDNWFIHYLLPSSPTWGCC